MSARTLLRTFVMIALTLVLVTALGALTAAHAASSQMSAGHKYVRSGDGKQKSVTTVVTWYGYNGDDSPRINPGASQEACVP